MLRLSSGPLTDDLIFNRVERSDDDCIWWSNKCSIKTLNIFFLHPYRRALKSFWRVFFSPSVLRPCLLHLSFLSLKKYLMINWGDSFDRSLSQQRKPSARSFFSALFFSSLPRATYKHIILLLLRFCNLDMEQQKKGSSLADTKENRPNLGHKQQPRRERATFFWTHEKKRAELVNIGNFNHVHVCGSSSKAVRKWI